MPANESSLRITEAYRTRMIAIRNRAKREARVAWAQVDPNDLDTYQPSMLALQVTQLQREAAQLSAGYLSAYVASERNEPPELPFAVALQAGTARSGSDLGRAFLGPMIGVKVDIREGKDRLVALREGGRRLERTAGLATDEAAREALRVAMDLSPLVDGYRRAIKGTCEACLAAAAEADEFPREPGVPLEIHPDCQCVSEPNVIPRAPRETMRGREPTPGDMIDYGYDSYVGSPESFDLNAFLRGKAYGPEEASYFKSWANQMDEGLAKTGAVGEWTRAFRNVRGDLKSIGLPHADERSVGKVFVDRAYGSATGSGTYAEQWVRGGNVMFTLDVDPRVKGVWGMNPVEDEFLLERGVRYVIKSVTSERNALGHRTWRVRATVLPPVRKPKLPD